MYYVKMFVVSLLLTLIIENIVAFFLGERGKRTVVIVSLVNILTNPLAVLSYLLLSLRFSALSPFALQLPVELAVFICEALIYRAFSVKKADVIRHPVMLSLICNACSYGIGLLIDFII